MGRERKRKVLAWILVVGWMAIIFMFSHEPADVSASKSGLLVETLERLLFGEQSPFHEAKDSINLQWWVRKGAHVGAFGVLAALAWNALRFDVQDRRRLFGLAVGVAVAYAVFDETHQLFIEGRSGSVTDVFIDALGAVLGAGLVWVTLKYNDKHSDMKPSASN